MQNLEEWKNLIEHYSISNLGNVKNNNTGRNLKLIRKNKYSFKVTLTLENNSKRKDIYPLHLAKQIFYEENRQ